MTEREIHRAFDQVAMLKKENTNLKMEIEQLKVLKRKLAHPGSLPAKQCP